MNIQQVPQPRSLANGHGRRRVEKESANRPDLKSQSGRPTTSRVTNPGPLAGSKGGGNESPSRERLVYITACLIGQNVEVQVKDGSYFSGIFHATSAEKEFGVILKMARSTKPGTQGQKFLPDSTSRAPSKTLIIPAKELVQITAKDVPLTRDSLTNDVHRVKQQEIMIDSSISQSRHIDVERELERWVPDEDIPQCPELENIFDGPWNRGWDQFQANETLFGVKSTFDEELYTTKLERGPLTRDLEKQASRLANEIEGEDTQDSHLAEERGMDLHENLDIDEETKYSSVYRGVDDSGYGEDEDILLDSHNTETFGSSPGPVVSKFYGNLVGGESNDGSQACSSTGEGQSSLPSAELGSCSSDSRDHPKLLVSESPSKSSPLNSENRSQQILFSGQHAGNSFVKGLADKQMIPKEVERTKPDDQQSSFRENKNGSDLGGLSSTASSYASVSLSSSKEKTSSHELTDDTSSIKRVPQPTSWRQPGSSASSTSECGGAASASNRPALSPSSSMGSLSSEKSTLNPHAKEFKLNPHAKSFVPSPTPLRPSSPVSDGSFYFPTSAAAVPHMHGMPVGIGVGASFAHQPVMFNSQIAPVQSPQPYFHPNGPQYGQQMLVGHHPRQVLYMPAYPPEMQYKGRDY